MKLGPLDFPVANINQAAMLVVIIIATIALARQVWPTDPKSPLFPYRP